VSLLGSKKFQPKFGPPGGGTGPAPLVDITFSAVVFEDSRADHGFVELTHDPCNGVREIVVATGGVIDAVAAAACCAPFKANDLGDKSRVVGQFDLPRIDGGQQVAIEIAFRFRGGLINDAVTTEALARPLAAIAVVGDFGKSDMT
jgi:hypothetical protein